MNKDILVTVGLATYNSIKYLPLTIKSIFSQDYENFELIITDDFSTDNTQNYLKSLKDNRIRLILDNENKGLSYRLNQQIGLARGTLFFRMDDDDIMPPDRISKCVDFFHNNPDKSIVGGRAIIIDKNNKVYGYSRSAVDFSLESICKYGAYIHPTVCFNLKKIHPHYNQNFSGIEDLDLWIRSKLDGEAFGFIDDFLLYYRELTLLDYKKYLKRIQIEKKYLLYMIENHPETKEFLSYRLDKKRKRAFFISLLIRTKQANLFLRLRRLFACNNFVKKPTCTEEKNYLVYLTKDTV